MDEHELERSLTHDRNAYLIKFTQKSFGFEALLRELDYHQRSFNKAENRSLKQKFLPWTQELIRDTISLKETGMKFERQVNHLLEQEETLAPLADRMHKAQGFFVNELNQLIKRITDQLKGLKSEKSVKTYRQELQEFRDLFISSKQQIIKLSQLIQETADDKELTKDTLRSVDGYRTAPVKQTRKDKQPTAQVSFELYKAGKDIAAIADERGLVKTTIEGHLAQFVEAGILDVTELLPTKRLNQIVEKYTEDMSSKDLKEALPEDVSYSEIRLALAHVHSMENNET